MKMFVGFLGTLDLKKSRPRVPNLLEKQAVSIYQYVNMYWLHPRAIAFGFLSAN